MTPCPPGAQRDHRSLKEGEEEEGGVRAMSRRRTPARGQLGHQPENAEGDTLSLAREKGPATPGLQLTGTPQSRGRC